MSYRILIFCKSKVLVIWRDFDTKYWVEKEIKKDTHLKQPQQ